MCLGVGYTMEKDPKDSQRRGQGINDDSSHVRKDLSRNNTQRLFFKQRTNGIFYTDYYTYYFM
ncbi:MAG TPA: hypothetical protein CFH80_02295 [Sulfurospirillum cavolei]|uniref:Uncharacterized protein n=1 Tax=Sulfurospirillum cavolei TaxID=366522 RepID=A0A2D3WCX2_9BACT|nr:MAG: hypothetical protein OA34_03755 [Sulfurospirillum sp. MES]DAB36930.1 MAG TPA: hypothetical protein CFH80_02295 [Sulfurospirillum cavolei]